MMAQCLNRRRSACLRTMLFTACVMAAAVRLFAAGERAEDHLRPDSDGGASLAAGRVGPSSSADRVSSKERIDALIRKLGSPRFSDRRAAANELNHIGPEAFDQLQAATDATDPEVAASARYLLRQINVRWTRSDDPAIVQRLLRDYVDQDDDLRGRLVEALGELPEGGGVAALCRIARFDRSAVISRAAAAAIVHPPLDAADRTLDSEVFDRELGDSTRIASQWLRQYQLQLRDPAAAVAGWKWFIDDESRRLEEGVDETSASIVSDLLWNLADVYQRLGDTNPLVEAMGRIVELGGEDSDDAVVELLQWLPKRKAWDAMDQWAARHDERIRRSKPSLYLLALARATQGNDTLADELASAALAIPTKTDLEGIQAAQIISELGHFDWAVREYRHTIDTKPLKSPDAVAACTMLSNLLQDHQQYEDAAEAIEPLMKLLEKDSEFAAQYRRLRTPFFHLGVNLMSVESVHARFHFMQACRFEELGDYSQQREQLLLAIGHDEQDADVLIAMYHAKDADDAWREATRKRIDELADAIEEGIEENRDSATLYNHWAWLVANTEGDYRKAIRYSKRSLELSPNEASLLDTLGRCYFAAGELEKAVKTQRKAVGITPHMQVMQRQLAQFEKALAEQQGPDAGDQEPGPTD